MAHLPSKLVLQRDDRLLCPLFAVGTGRDLLQVVHGMPEGRARTRIESMRAPCLSRDGHYLFFSSNRPGGFGNQDLYVSYRQNTHDDFGWETPVNLGPGINTSDPEFGPAYLENDDTGVPTLHFARREGGGDSDIFVSTFQPDGSLGPPVLVTELSTESDDLRPTIRANGLELCFNSNRPGSAINDLWFSTRGSIFEPWSVPVNAGPIVNSAFNDQFPALSPDGTTLIFSSNRPGGFGSNDLYLSRRPKLLYTEFTSLQDARMDQIVPLYRPSLMSTPSAQSIAPPATEELSGREFDGASVALAAAPNPFSGETHFTFSLPRAGTVSLRIYNVAGQLVRTLIDGKQDAGVHSASFRAKDLPAGMYFTRLQLGTEQTIRSVILVP